DGPMGDTALHLLVRFAFAADVGSIDRVTSARTRIDTRAGDVFWLIEGGFMERVLKRSGEKRAVIELWDASARTIARDEYWRRLRSWLEEMIGPTRGLRFEGSESATPATGIYLAYAAADASWADRITREALSSLIDDERITVRGDRERLPAGEQWDQEVERALADSDIALVLASSAYFDSPARVAELAELTRTAHDGALRLTWVVVQEDERIRGSELPRFQAVLDPARPLLSLDPKEQQEALRQIGESIGRLAAEIREGADGRNATA
ncbi:MAG: TIR domain-containing protein, partial [Longimicrobiales bacterium]